MCMICGKLHGAPSDGVHSKAAGNGSRFYGQMHNKEHGKLHVEVVALIWIFGHQNLPTILNFTVTGQDITYKIAITASPQTALNLPFPTSAAPLKNFSYRVVHSNPHSSCSFPDSHQADYCHLTRPCCATLSLAIHMPPKWGSW